MAAERKDAIEEKDLHGFKHFKLLMPMLEKLHEDGCRRDKAGNRVLHYDQYAALILLYFFNPIVTSLRGIQQTSELQKVQRLLGCPRAALGSLSEAARVFDPDLLRGVIGDLVEQLAPISKNTAFDEIKGVLTLVDGSLMPALPRLAEAMWLNDQNRAFKLHTHFELLKAVPVRMGKTKGTFWFSGENRGKQRGQENKGDILVFACPGCRLGLTCGHAQGSPSLGRRNLLRCDQLRQRAGRGV